MHRLNGIGGVNDSADVVRIFEVSRQVLPLRTHFLWRYEKSAASECWRRSTTRLAPRFASATAAPLPMDPVAPAIRIVCCSVILFHRYDDIPLFVPLIDILVGLGSLFQWIALIYDRFYLSGLNKLLEKNQIRFVAYYPPDQFLAACH